MGGQMALAQAALAVANDPERAIELLDTARLLAPGTLVEEAALRREILVADQVDDQAKFEALSRQYLSRFRHSVYAGNFRYRFAAILTHLKFADEAAQTKSLDDMFRDLDPSTARELYLTVARAAVVQGKAQAAAIAAERASAISPDGSTDQARAHLYRAAALVITPDGLDSAIVEAQAIRPELLNGSDRALRDAARIAIEAIAKADTVANRAGGDPAVPKGVEPSAIMLRAEKALQAADTLLEETSQ
jgi:chemotaxis protein MotC